MRITGGRIRGRRLISPHGLSIRPTSDKVRESLFNVIGQDLSGLSVLDLYAGTGSLGLEALSRGAVRAVFVDESEGALRLVRKNVELCGVGEVARILKWDLRKGVSKVTLVTQERYGLVFLDPPYGQGLIPPLLKDLSTGLILSTGAKVIAECSKREALPPNVGRLTLSDERLYGDTKLIIYMDEDEE